VESDTLCTKCLNQLCAAAIQQQLDAVYAAVADCMCFLVGVMSVANVEIMHPCDIKFRAQDTGDEYIEAEARV